MSDRSNHSFLDPWLRGIAVLYRREKLFFNVWETIWTTPNTYCKWFHKGSVVLRHLNACNNAITTRINNVFYCKDLTCWLLFLGAFLQNGFIVTGDKRFIRINTPDGAEFITFVPRFLGDTIFVLQILNFTMQCPSTHLARTVNFDIVHKHFGHPLREVLRQARKHTRDFLYIVRGQYLGHRLVSFEGLNLLVAYWQFVYCVPIVPGFSCLYHAVQCLIFYI